jgi:hypothetical protein
VAQLGTNAHGEVLEPGRVPDCYLGLLLAPSSTTEAPEVLVVAPAALLHPCVPQPDGTLLYELVSGHPDRQPRELVFLPDLTCELRAWPADTWACSTGHPGCGSVHRFPQCPRRTPTVRTPAAVPDAAVDSGRCRSV